MSEVIVLTTDQVESLFDKLYIRLESIIKDSQIKEEASKEFLTANEVCKLLKVSGTTLHDWSKKGLLQKHHLGINRIRFRHDEVIEAMNRTKEEKRIIIAYYWQQKKNAIENLLNSKK